MTDLNPSARRQIRQRQIGQRVRRLVNSMTGGSAPVSPFDDPRLSPPDDPRLSPPDDPRQRVDTTDPRVAGGRGSRARLVRAAAFAEDIPIADIPDDFLTGDRTIPEINAMISDLVSRKTALRLSFPEGYESDETLELPRNDTREAADGGVDIPPIPYIALDGFMPLSAPSPRTLAAALSPRKPPAPPNEGESKEEDEHLQEEKFPDDENEMSFQE